MEVPTTGTLNLVQIFATTVVHGHHRNWQKYIRD